MHVTFIRHAQLAPPYDDYNRLSLSQLNALAAQDIDPHIDQNFHKAIEESLARLESFRHNTIIYYPHSIRGYETAQVVKKILSERGLPPKRMVAATELNEIIFQPELMISEHDYQRTGMTAIRQAMTTSLFAQPASVTTVESLSSIQKRIIDLHRKFLRYGENAHIICITHGFLMRFLQLYFLMGQTTFSPNTQSTYEAMVNFTYGDGFSVNFKNKKKLNDLYRSNSWWRNTP